MKKIFKYIFISSLIILATTVIPTPTFAANCSGVETAYIECEGGGDAGIWHILLLVIEILSIGIGITALIGILIFGVQYLTAGGDVSKATKAKRRMLEIVLGLVGWVVLYAFTEWLMPGGKFNFFNEITDIKLSLSSSSIETGKTATTTVTFVPENPTDRTYSLSTDDANIASVAGYAVVCKSEGSTSITATSVNGKQSTATITCTKPVETNNNNNNNNNGTSSAGSALSKEELISKYESMSTPTWEETKNLAQSIYGSEISDNDFIGILAWTRNENYWESDLYFNYLCSCAYVNHALAGINVLSEVNGYEGYDGVGYYGTKQYIESGSGYTKLANEAALKTTYLALSNTNTIPWSAHGIMHENGYYSGQNGWFKSVMRSSDAYYCTNVINSGKACVWPESAKWYYE